MTKLLLLLALLLLALWLLGPREPVRLVPVAVDLPDDLEDWLTARDAGIRPDVAARLIWAGEPGMQTDLSIVYLHGFSASPRELSPVPERLAAEFGANLFITRLTGHGQDGAALAGTSVADWWRDTAEAIAVGQRLGRRVVIIGTSTGATLAAEAARDPALGQGIDGVVMISGNFQLKAQGAQLLTWPFARWWLPRVAGETRCFEPRSPDHAAAWTSCYPTVSVLPMAALVQHARGGDYAAARQPVLFIWAEADQVVDPAAAMRVAQGWGGAVTKAPVVPGPGDDPSRHVIAGDIVSPGMTGPVTAIIADWLRANLN